MLELLRHGFRRLSAYQLAAGTRIKPLRDTWATWSPLSGDSLQLNHEAAAVLELLEEGHADPEVVARLLADETELPLAAVAESLQHVWQLLLDAGLIEPRATELAAPA